MLAYVWMCACVFCEHTRMDLNLCSLQWVCARMHACQRLRASLVEAFIEIYFMIFLEFFLFIFAKCKKILFSILSACLLESVAKLRLDVWWLAVAGCNQLKVGGPPAACCWRLIADWQSTSMSVTAKSCWRSLQLANIWKWKVCCTVSVTTAALPLNPRPLSRLTLTIAAQAEVATVAAYRGASALIAIISSCSMAARYGLCLSTP